jgi:hypothetical protein
MQHAKRMVLVDEKFLENIWRKESSSWKKPTEQKAKFLLNNELKSDLDDPAIPDDVKAKHHQQHLNRFLHTTRQLPVTSQDLITFEPEVDNLLNLDDITKIDDLKVKPKKVKRKASVPIRRSKRKPKKVEWEEWT